MTSTHEETKVKDSQATMKQDTRAVVKGTETNVGEFLQ